MGDETDIRAYSGEAPSQPTHWTLALTSREMRQLAHARAYEATFSDSGAPGHSHFMLLAKLAKLLDAREAR